MTLGPTVEFNRNRYFMFGVLLLLLGIQFRMVHSVVLNETGTRALAKIAKGTQLASQTVATDVYLNVAPKPRKKIEPPHWLGWILLTVGGVICLHALALPPPRQ